jgi:hypothetical protein
MKIRVLSKQSRFFSGYAISKPRDDTVLKQSEFIITGYGQLMTAWSNSCSHHPRADNNAKKSSNSYAFSRESLDLGNRSPIAQYFVKCIFTQVSLFFESGDEKIAPSFHVDLVCGR